jgi:uncharacterized membrane-anchored protein
MKPSRTSGGGAAAAAVATVRSHPRTSVVLSRLGPGDIAVIHQIDLDATTARELLRRRPSAVVNTAPFISGRVANLGPGLLLDAGVACVEAPDLDPEAVRDGSRLRLEDGVLYDGDREVAHGTVLTDEEVTRRRDAARVSLAAQLDSFTSNAAEFLRRDEDVLLHGRGVPAVRTPLRDRPVVVIGPDAAVEELRQLRRYLREQRPAVIAVDGGAAVAARRRLRPDVVVLAEDAVTGQREDEPPLVGPRSLRRARDVVVHTRRPGESAAEKRLAALGVEPVRSSGSLGAFDVGLLLAHHAGASLVVPVGSRAGLDELVDGSRAEQASSFLARLRVGPRLVDADAVPQLYAGRVAWWWILLVLLAGLVAVAAAVATTPLGHEWWDQLRTHLSAVDTKG